MPSKARPRAKKPERKTKRPAKKTSLRGAAAEKKKRTSSARAKPEKRSAPKKKKTLATKKAAKPKRRAAAQGKSRGGGARAKLDPPPPPVSERIPPAAPSERVVQALALAPIERPLTDEEREAMDKVAFTALRFLDVLEVPRAPEEVVRRIGAFIDEVRSGTRTAPESQDLCLGTGVLWGEQIRTQVGWLWVHLTYPDGFASYALVPDDRAFACFPLNRIPELMKAGARANTSVQLFHRIRASELPTRRANAYVVIG